MQSSVCADIFHNAHVFCTLFFTCGDHLKRNEILIMDYEIYRITQNTASTLHVELWNYIVARMRAI